MGEVNLGLVGNISILRDKGDIEEPGCQHRCVQEDEQQVQRERVRDVHS